MALLSMEVNVESMRILLIMLGLDHVGLDFLCFKYRNKCCQGLFTRTVYVSVSVTINVYHCAYGDGPFDGQNGYRTHSVHQTDRFH